MVSGAPYRQSAEPVNEVHDDVERFRRALARERQSTLLTAGYCVVVIADYIALPAPINLVVAAAINLAVAVALALTQKRMH